ncbi:MAG: glucose-1-phosphate adenylyltransferase [Spirochaetes bacterium GWD1_27_9]|nr:MAG: glucose-1-phosphate adenylyltransferase [Spirochaetes bacterium GWB1_27_13]OHD35174.1 MAG: glucose-1-phosphate adenylyltransferase [Spirochaetes bacterium GWD1_27_9]
MQNVICLILGGGQGSRLFPLTKDRSKPAVPIGGKYRLIDIPISNCLNSNINRIFILTQFNSASLNKHINHTYRFDNFHKGFVDILAAEQSTESKDWYQGTADAVRKNLKHITAFFNVSHVLILSGDQVYTMDFKQLFAFHKETSSEITVPVLPVSREDAPGFGIVKLNKDYIVDFIEKPKDPNVLDEIKSGKFIKEKFEGIENDKEYLASMGIYLFNIDTLIQSLETGYKDFGKEIIPWAIKNKKVSGFLFNDYWEDVGTIKSFWKANLDFTMASPKFDFFKSSIYTNARYLPPSRLINCNIFESLISEGAILKNANIKKSLIGIRSIIQDNTTVENSLIMGADFYENEEGKEYNRKYNIINIGIGNNTTIKNAIIDKNARIGKNCKIINKKELVDFDGGNYYIRDGIIIVPKNSTIQDDTEI